MRGSPKTAPTMTLAVATLAELVTDAYHRDPAELHRRARRLQEAVVHVAVDTAAAGTTTSRTARRRRAPRRSAPGASAIQLRELIAAEEEA